MYVFGGYDGSAWLNDMFDFDFERGASLAQLVITCSSIVLHCQALHDPPAI